MHELGLDAATVATWFPVETETPYLLVRVPTETAAAWAELLSVPVRRCYAGDETLRVNAKRTGAPLRELLAALVPDAGSTMAGDFGEIVAALHQAAQRAPEQVLDPKKWRLKQDRTKPTPHSDVVQFFVPEWPASSERDAVLCAEVKTKSTPGPFDPIASAVYDSKKDQDGRLIKTLVWLREQALRQSLGSVSLEHLDRFIQATDHPPAERLFRAVAVICTSLVDKEIAGASMEELDSTTVVIIAIPDLKRHYSGVYEAVLSSTIKGLPG